MVIAMPTRFTHLTPLVLVLACGSEAGLGSGLTYHSGTLNDAGPDPLVTPSSPVCSEKAGECTGGPETVEDGAGGAGALSVIAVPLATSGGVGGAAAVSNGGSGVGTAGAPATVPTTTAPTGCIRTSWAAACAGLDCGEVDDGCGDSHLCGSCAPTPVNSDVGNQCLEHVCTVVEDLPRQAERMPPYDASCTGIDSNFPDAWFYGTSAVTSCIVGNPTKPIHDDLICCGASEPCQEIATSPGMVFNCEGRTPANGCTTPYIWLGRLTHHYDCR